MSAEVELRMLADSEFRLLKVNFITLCAIEIHVLLFYSITLY